jgi:hypothetical protein
MIQVNQAIKNSKFRANTCELVHSRAFLHPPLSRFNFRLSMRLFAAWIEFSRPGVSVARGRWARDRWLRLAVCLGHPYGSTRASHPGSLAPDCSKVSTCCRSNLRTSPKPVRGRRGRVRSCSPCQRSASEKIRHVRASPQQKFPRRALNLRNVIHVLDELFSHASKMP